MVIKLNLWIGLYFLSIGSLTSALLCRRDCGEACRICGQESIAVLKCCPDIDIRGGWEEDYEEHGYSPHEFFFQIPPRRCFTCGKSCSRFCHDFPRYKLCCRGEIRP